MEPVSVIIINYHTELLLDRCISSMLNFHAGEPLEIIVVNNGGDLDVLKQKHNTGLVRFVEPGNNIGFSAANNLGLKHATHDHVLFLNSDVEFHEKVIADCVDQFKKNTHIGIVGCKLLNVDQTLQLSYHDGDKWLRKLIRRNPFIIKLANGSKLASRSMDLIREYHNHSHYVPWLSGAFLMVKKSELVDLGGWDERFFMYWEDVDLCYRYRRSGKRIYYFNERSVVHLGGGGSNPSISRFRMMEDSRLMWLKKTGYFNPFIYRIFMKFNLALDKFFLKRKGQEPDSSMSAELEYYNLK